MTQYELSQKIVKDANVNIVTCGMCGDVFLHKMEEEELQCPHCDFTSDPADFPDLYHEEYNRTK